MSRSQKKTPIFGIAGGKSERADKKIWHGRLRALERSALASSTDLDDHMTTTEREASNPWTFAKDGKSFWPRLRQKIVAERLAQTGRTKKEQASLAHRWLKKFNAK